MVQGGEKRTKSADRRRAGKKWNPRSVWGLGRICETHGE